MKSREKRHWRVKNNERGRWNVAVARGRPQIQYSTVLLYTLVRYLVASEIVMELATLLLG